MWLRNLHECSSGRLIDIEVSDGLIQSVIPHQSGDENASERTDNREDIFFEDAIVFPGLINSHDHLDFNCFPQLGNRIYKNYLEWGDNIHLNNKEIIDRVLKIPKQLRIQWGIYKNLLNGFTTVVNHGEWVSEENAPITIHQQCHVLHSVGLEKNWKWRLNKPFRKDKYPFVIHIGEGTDELSAREARKLISWNFLGKPLIGVHGVSMQSEDAQHFKGLVWCPASNFFLLGRTAAIDKLKDKTSIVFGTDSTVSAPWNAWQHLRQARATGMASDAELYDMLTSAPAALWQLGKTGDIAVGYDADLVIARRKNGLSGMETFYAIDPEDILMVTHKGKISLLDGELYHKLQKHENIETSLSYFTLNGTKKYLHGEIEKLMSGLKEFYLGEIGAYL